MARVPVQPVASQVVEQALRTGRLPSVFLFHGKMDEGPLELALFIAKASVCERNDGTACDRCPPCIAMHRFRHPALLPVFNDDRLPRLRQLSHWVMADASEQGLRLRFELVGEVNNLMARQRDRWLTPISAEKKSFPQGIKVKPEELSEAMARLATWDRELRDPAPLSRDPMVYEAHLEAARKVQDSLDRSLLSKENIMAVQEKTRLAPDAAESTLSPGGNPGMSRGRPGRWVMIQHMERMSTQTLPSLLKWLEEPPEGTRFVLMTPALHLLHPEVAEPLASRSQVLGFRPLGPAVKESWLRRRFRLKQGAQLEPGLGEGGDLPEILMGLLVENLEEGGYNAWSVVGALESLGPSMEDILGHLEGSLRGQGAVLSGHPKRVLQALERARGVFRAGHTPLKNQMMKLALELIPSNDQ